MQAEKQRRIGEMSKRIRRQGGGGLETECRSGLERLLHEGGLGSTANYA